MAKSKLSVQDVTAIRNEPNAVGLMRLAQERGWSDEETAQHYNEQSGTGGNWKAKNVADHRAWLASAGIWKADGQAGASQAQLEIGDNYAMVDGVRYAMTPVNRT